MKRESMKISFLPFVGSSVVPFRGKKKKNFNQNSTQTETHQNVIYLGFAIHPRDSNFNCEYSDYGRKIYPGNFAKPGIAFRGFINIVFCFGDLPYFVPPNHDEFFGEALGACGNLLVCWFNNSGTWK
jgi:hypothetical protein